MPSIEKADLKQTAVLWLANVETPDSFGNPTVASPIEVRVRWESSKGEANRRKVTAYVDREITHGSVLWLGTVATLPVSPQPYKDLMQVVGYSEIPNVKGRSPRRSVDLVLLGTSLPQVV